LLPCGTLFVVRIENLTIARVCGIRFVEGGDLAMSMMEFVADNSLAGTEAPKFRDIVMGRSNSLDVRSDNTTALPAKCSCHR
jgi:hypothetical protein